MENEEDFNDILSVALVRMSLGGYTGSGAGASDAFNEVDANRFGVTWAP